MTMTPKGREQTMNQVSIEFWTVENVMNPSGRLATCPTYGQAFDYADTQQAVRIKDGFGSIYRRIAGEWVQMP